MKNQSNLWQKPAVLAGLAFGVLAFSCQPQDEPILSSDTVEFVGKNIDEPIPGQYIMTMQPTGIRFRKDMSYDAVQASMRKTSSGLLAKYRISEENLGFVYGSSIEGFSVNLTEEQAELLAKDPLIKAIDQDRVIGLAPPPGKGKGGGGSDPQQIPYGITRVGGGETYLGTNKVYIIDSGIDSTHPDLNVDVASGFSAIKGKYGSLRNDANFHGTHVAGTVAAIDNSFGVVGVAAGATVVPIKILDETNTGSWSDAIAGIDFVAANANPGDVANMSFAGLAFYPVDAAVIALGEAGVKVAIRAGNEGKDANNYSPARANGVNLYTVSAIDEIDNYASFSNFGNPPIDFAAPGVNVLSTIPGGLYRYLNGTSMASPHVAGLLLWGTPNNGGPVGNDTDGNVDQVAIR